MFKITITLKRPPCNKDDRGHSIILHDRKPISSASDIWGLLWAFDASSGIAAIVQTQGLPIKEMAHGLYLASGRIVTELNLPITIDPGYVSVFIDGANWEVHYHIVPDNPTAVNELGFFRVPDKPQ